MQAKVMSMATKSTRAKTPRSDPKPSKYHNKKTVVDGITFDSKKESHRYRVLKSLAIAGKIHLLRRQVRFPLTTTANGQRIKVCTYVADFTYVIDGTLVVEDVKGMRTAMYLLKRKWLLLEHGIEVREV